MGGIVPNNVCFVVDGFNLYHSVVRAHKETGVNCRWLDIWALCNSYRYLLGPDSRTAAVHYFSALAHHAEAWRPGTVKRHEAYIRALESTGVNVELSVFKEKHIRYRRPNEIEVDILRHEEKETDVALGTRLIECALDPNCDSMVLVTGDSDIAPAITAMRTIAPQKPVFALFPAYKGNQRFRGLVKRTIKIRYAQYALHQLPDQVVTPSGQIVRKPSDWV